MQEVSVAFASFKELFTKFHLIDHLTLFANRQ